jgi:hypothetical protein
MAFKLDSGDAIAMNGAQRLTDWNVGTTGTKRSGGTAGTG